MRTRSQRTLAVLAVAAASALGVAGTAASAASAASSDTVTIGNTLPRWLATAGAAPSAAAATETPMSVRVYLTPNGGLAALQAKVKAVSDPGSSQYGHFVSSADFDRAYAPTSAAVSRVSAYLKTQGVNVDGVEGHRRYIEASGNRATLSTAFGTSLGTYVHNGETVTAPARAVTLPAEVGTAVLTVTGLDTSTQLKKPNNSNTVDAPARGAAPSANPAAQPPGGFRNARPCNIDYGTLRATSLPSLFGEKLPYAPCGYTGPQFRSAYEGATALDGTGVTVAITDAYAWQLIAKDAETYASQNGDGSYAPGQLTQSLPSSYRAQALCGPSGWSGEETLDVEAVHAMAPGAKIRYYASRSCLDNDFQDTLARVVDDNRAKLVTNSWSDLEQNVSSASIAAYEQVFLQGAMQGISFLFSSGDNGDELGQTGVRQVDYPASDPSVTAAGGTSTAILHGQLIGQTGWGSHNYRLSPDGKSWQDTGFLYGAGGGFSALFNRPDYQNSKVPASSPAGRAVPDVSMDADPNTGMLIGQTQAFPEGVHYGEYRIGGTSLASPLLAGMFALAAQNANSGFGLLNPKLYKAGGAITDVTANGMPDKGVVRVNFNNRVDASAGTTPFVRTFNQDSTLTTTPGWDDTTGLGVPNPGIFAKLAH